MYWKSCVGWWFRNKLKSLIKDERCRMKDDGWKTKDEGWRMKNDGWKMKDDGGFVDKQTDRQTDVSDCRLAFATENLVRSVYYTIKISHSFSTFNSMFFSQQFLGRSNVCWEGLIMFNPSNHSLRRYRNQNKIRSHSSLFGRCQTFQQKWNVLSQVQE